MRNKEFVECQGGCGKMIRQRVIYEGFKPMYAPCSYCEECSERLVNEWAKKGKHENPA